MRSILLCVISVAACGEESIPLPSSTPFETRGLRLLMSAAELETARPGVYADPEGNLREYFLRSWITYGLHPTAPGAGPPPSARLEWVEYTEELRDSAGLAIRWSDALSALETELGLLPTCRVRLLGSTTLRRAVFDTLPRVVLSSRVSRSPDPEAAGITFTAAVLATPRSDETSMETDGPDWRGCESTVARPRAIDDPPNPR